MGVPNADRALRSCVLRQILENQGPDAARLALESFGQPGASLRLHVQTCPACTDVLAELYGDKKIPEPRGNYLTPELEKLLRDLDEML